MASAPLQVERIEKFADLEALKETWNTLLRHNSTRTVELTYEWQTTYWKYFHQNTELFVLVVKEAGSVVAIAPLKLTHTTQFGANVRVLEFIAADESNYQDFIAKQNDERILACLLGYLKDNRQLWDMLNLMHIPEQSPTAHFLLNAQDNIPLCRIAKIEKCIFIKVNGIWEEQIQKLSKKSTRKKMRKRISRLKKFGELDYACCSNEEELETGLQKFFNFHRKRWNPTNTPSQFNEDRYCDFYSEVSQKLFNKGQANLAILRVGKIPVAMIYFFLYDHAYLLQLGTYDTDYGKGSPAIVLQELIIRQAFADGIRIIDDGYYYPYKELWAHGFKQRLNIEMYPRGLRPYYFYVLHSLKHFFRTNLKKITPLRELIRYARRKIRSMGKREISEAIE